MTQFSLDVDRDYLIAAALHDIVEDTDMTLIDLAEMGCSSAAVQAINLLTRKPGEEYETYIVNLGANPIARAVKIADLRDNMDLTRLKDLTAKDIDRIQKYHAAYNYLIDVQEMAGTGRKTLTPNGK